MKERYILAQAYSQGDSFYVLLKVDQFMVALLKKGVDTALAFSDANEVEATIGIRDYGEFCVDSLPDALDKYTDDVANGAILLPPAEGPDAWEHFSNAEYANSRSSSHVEYQCGRYGIYACVYQKHDSDIHESDPLADIIQKLQENFEA